MNHLPLKEFHRCVERYHGHHKLHSYSCLDQLLCLAFAQLTYRESLRDIEVCLSAQQGQWYHMGIRRLYSHAVEKTSGAQCDQTSVLSGYYSAKD